MNAIFLNNKYVFHNMSLFIVMWAVVLVTAFPVYSETITLKVATFSDGSHKYYYELLQQSLEAIGHQVILETPSWEHLPQKRVVRMLDKGELSLFYLIQSEARDKKYTPVEVGITNGLIGHRILFIPKGQQTLYDNVNTLEDFRQLGKVGGLGVNWFDVKVWQANNLKYYKQDGEWRVLYKKVAEGKYGVDYFSRGFNEIVAESKLYPELDIEQRLVLIYDRDFRFYLSRPAAHYKNVLEEALHHARESGLMDKLVYKYWAEAFEALHLDQRVKIYLETPK